MGRRARQACGDSPRRGASSYPRKEKRTAARQGLHSPSATWSGAAWVPGIPFLNSSVYPLGASAVWMGTVGLMGKLRRGKENLIKTIDALLFFWGGVCVCVGGYYHGLSTCYVPDGLFLTDDAQ